jgi:hypothetical protein
LCLTRGQAPFSRRGSEASKILDWDLGCKTQLPTLQRMAAQELRRAKLLDWAEVG